MAQRGRGQVEVFVENLQRFVRGYQCLMRRHRCRGMDWLEGGKGATDGHSLHSLTVKGRGMGLHTVIAMGKGAGLMVVNWDSEKILGEKRESENSEHLLKWLGCDGCGCNGEGRGTDRQQRCRS